MRVRTKFYCYFDGMPAPTVKRRIVVLAFDLVTAAHRAHEIAIADGGVLYGVWQEGEPMLALNEQPETPHEANMRRLWRGGDAN